MLRSLEQLTFKLGHGGCKISFEVTTLLFKAITIKP